MGAKYRTILNLEIIKSDLENNLLYLKGSIPGSKNSVVFLRKSVKTFNRKPLQKNMHKTQVKMQRKKRNQIIKNQLNKSNLKRNKL